MNCYRISKYNPEFRDENGIYTQEDWTSVSDIGRVFNGEKLTKEEYLRTENSYVNAVKTILTENNASKLLIDGLETYYDNTDVSALSFDESELLAEIKNTMYVNKDKLELLIRMALREYLWCKLKSERVEIEFGYDYYMYIKCAEIKLEIVQKLFYDGIFVEHHLERED